MASWGYVAAGYLLTLGLLGWFVRRTERRVARLRRTLRGAGR